ncbi:Phosphatidate cytidylyltransferase [Chitinispirillum alkaliphilum]|nr:Phosphatidate cytidylyltransferase [Chitinispirillum alkaliphilum]
MINWTNLKKRLLFVAWAVPLGWWFINSDFSILPRDVAVLYPGQVLAIALVMLAVYEYTKMLSLVYPVNAFWISYLWIGLQIVLFLSREPSPPGVLSIYILLVFVAIEAFFWGKRDKSRRWVRASLLFSGTVFLNIASISLVSLYHSPFQNLFITPSPTIISQLSIVVVLASVFLCDTGAYFAGNLWGKHHFSSISPNKTIEGSVAGLISSVIIVTIGWIFLRNPQLPLILGPILGILIGVSAQIGDLLVSLMKRFFKVKDASTIIPGHGGILDRFDSVFFTAPVVYLFSWVVTRIFSI